METEALSLCNECEGLLPDANSAGVDRDAASAALAERTIEEVKALRPELPQGEVRREAFNLRNRSADITATAVIANVEALLAGWVQTVDSVLALRPDFARREVQLWLCHFRRLDHQIDPTALVAAMDLASRTGFVPTFAWVPTINFPRNPIEGLVAWWST